MLGKDSTAPCSSDLTNKGFPLPWPYGGGQDDQDSAPEDLGELSPRENRVRGFGSVFVEGEVRLEQTGLCSGGGV